MRYFADMKVHSDLLCRERSCSYLGRLRRLNVRVVSLYCITNEFTGRYKGVKRTLCSIWELWHAMLHYRKYRKSTTELRNDILSGMEMSLKPHHSNVALLSSWSSAVAAKDRAHSGICLSPKTTIIYNRLSGEFINIPCFYTHYDIVSCLLYPIDGREDTLWL